MIDGEAVVVVEHVTKLRDQDFPEVDVQSHNTRRVEIEGEPCLRLDLMPSSDNRVNIGYVTCAMSVVNPIPQVCDAPPGVLTILDLLPYPSKNVARSRG